MSEDDHRGIYWHSPKVRVAAFSTTGLKGRTVVKIELSVSDPWELSDIVRQLAAQRGDEPRAKGAADA